MSTSDDVNAVSVLLVLQDTGVVFGSQNEQEVFALTLHINTTHRLQQHYESRTAGVCSSQRRHAAETHD